MEDTYSIKDLVRNLIAEVKQINSLKDTYKQNTIELDDYFKYSGKVEKSNETYIGYKNNKLEFDKFHSENRYKIIKKTEKYNKIISKERAKSYKSNKKLKQLWQKQK